MVREQPYKSRDTVGSDSGLGHLLVNIVSSNWNKEENEKWEEMYKRQILSWQPGIFIICYSFISYFYTTHALHIAIKISVIFDKIFILHNILDRVIINLFWFKMHLRNWTRNTLIELLVKKNLFCLLEFFFSKISKLAGATDKYVKVVKKNFSVKHLKDCRVSTKKCIFTT